MIFVLLLLASPDYEVRERTVASLIACKTPICRQLLDLKPKITDPEILRQMRRICQERLYLVDYEIHPAPYRRYPYYLEMATGRDGSRYTVSQHPGAQDYRSRFWLIFDPGPEPRW